MEMVIGYACCSVDERDQTAQRQVLAELGAAPERQGDTLVVPSLARLARSAGDARKLGEALVAHEVRLSLGGQVHDPADPLDARMFADLALFAEFEAELARVRIGEGMIAARTKERLRGGQPKLNKLHRDELRRMRATWQYTVDDLAEMFTVSRPTVYRALQPPTSTPLRVEEHDADDVVELTRLGDGVWAVAAHGQPLGRVVRTRTSSGRSVRWQPRSERNRRVGTRNSPTRRDAAQQLLGTQQNRHETSSR